MGRLLPAVIRGLLMLDCLMIRRGVEVVDILVERAAEGDVHDLTAAADRKRWDAGPLGVARRLEL